MIMKLLQGGNAIPPFLSYLPVTVTGAPEAPITPKKSSADGTYNLLDEQTRKMLDKLEGLPSDTTAFINAMLNFHIDNQYSSVNTSNIEFAYLPWVNLLSIAKFNYELFNDAMKTVSLNGGINEFAITDRGLLFCVNSEGDFQLFSPEELKDNSEYKPLTNSELLNYRAHSPALANNNELIRVVKNGIGMESVNKMILSSIGNLGTTSESNEGFARTQASQLINGLLDFIKALLQSGHYDATIDNLYKGKLLTKNQAILARAALNYIYSTLPANAKTLLKTKTVNGTDEEAIKLVQTLITSKLNSTLEFSLDFDEGSSSKTKGVNDKTEDDLVTQIQAGRGGHDTVYLLNNKSGVGMTVDGRAYELIKDTSGEHIGRTSVENLLNESGLRSIINADNGIYFGDLRVDLDSLLKIAYDGKGLLRTNLPIRSDGSPNFTLLEEYSQALSEFLLTSLTNEDRLRIFGDTEKYPNLNSLITPTGELDKTKFAPFIVVSGITTDNMIGIDDLNKFLTETKQTPELVLQLKTSLAVGTGKLTLYPDIDEYDWTEWLSFGLNGYDHVFKGNVYIPLNMNKLAAVTGGNLDIDTTTALMLETEYQRRDMTFLKADPSLLLNN